MVEARIRQWVCGQKKALLEEAKAAVRIQRLKGHRGRKRKIDAPVEIVPALPEATRRAVLRAVREGALSKAARILLSAEQCMGREAEAALRSLHPQAAPPSIPDVPVAEMDDFEPEDIKRHFVLSLLALVLAPRG